MTGNGIWNRNFILIMLANFCAVQSYLLLLPTYPLYLQELGYSKSVIGLLAGIFTLTSIMLRPFVGQKLNSGNRKAIYFAGQLITVVAVCFYPAIHAFGWLLMLRLLHGVGISITTTSANTIVTEFIPQDRMGEGLGYFSLSAVLSMAIAPGMGLFIVDQGGFGMLFASAVGLSLLSALFGLGVRYGRRRQDSLSLAARKAAKGGLLEKSAIRPAFVMFLTGISFQVISAFLALYAAERGVGQIGLFFTIYAFSLFLARPITGKITDRVGFHAAVLPGTILISGSMLLLWQADKLWMFLVAAILFGFGYGSVQNALQAMAVLSSPGNRKGSAVSTFYIGLDLCILVGTSAGGFVAEAVGYSSMYLLTTIPVMLGLIFYILTDPRRRTRSAAAKDFHRE